MKEFLVLNPEKATAAECATFGKRESSRAVIFDKGGKVALLRVWSGKYYKLPGGGLERREDPMTALKREILEETGCEIDEVKELGMITEWRKFVQLHQISYCYVATVKGKKGTPHFMADEIEEGFECIWVSLDDALRRVKSSKPTNIEGSDYIVPREIAILNEAKNSLINKDNEKTYVKEKPRRTLRNAVRK